LVAHRSGGDFIYICTFLTCRVQLLGVPPIRSSPSATETAEASASLAAAITHPDLTQVEGSRFDYGSREFERQLTSGSDLVN
jgi:hypothetical protein